MKINGIEISGIKRIVFYKKNVFIRQSNGNGGWYWWDPKRGRYMGDTTMMKVVKGMAKNPLRRVWTHGHSINIERVGQKKCKDYAVKNIKIPLVGSVPTVVGEAKCL